MLLSTNMCRECEMVMQHGLLLNSSRWRDGGSLVAQFTPLTQVDLRNMLCTKKLLACCVHCNNPNPHVRRLLDLESTNKTAYIRCLSQSQWSTISSTLPKLRISSRPVLCLPCTTLPAASTSRPCNSARRTSKLLNLCAKRVTTNYVFCGVRSVFNPQKFTTSSVWQKYTKQ